jgi:hypothetical protein
MADRHLRTCDNCGLRRYLRSGEVLCWAPEVEDRGKEPQPLLMTLQAGRPTMLITRLSRVLMAANRMAVRLPLSSWVVVPQRPFFSLRPPCVRPSALLSPPVQ